MWWCGNTTQGNQTDHIWYATSTDLTHWSAPVSVLQTIGTSVQGIHSCDPTVIKATNDIYYMYFTSETSHIGGGTDNQIYLATSTNGTNWVHHDNGNPVIPLLSTNPRDTGNYGIGMSSVIFKDGGFLQLYINAALDSNLAKTVGGFSSDGGVTFPKINGGIPIVRLLGSPDFKYLPNAKKYIAVGGDNSKYELEMYLFSEDFQILKRIKLPLTSFSQACNSNVGIIGDRFGNVLSENNITIVYQSGPVNAGGDCHNPDTWNLYKMNINISSIIGSVPSPTPNPVPGDLNSDGKVDIFDYNLLVSNYGK